VASKEKLANCALVMDFSKLKSCRTQVILPVTGPFLDSVHPYQAESALRCLSQAVVGAQ